MDSDSEQNHYSLTAKGIYRIGHESKRLIKRMAYYDKYYENINYFHLMASVLSCLHEISER